MTKAPNRHRGVARRIQNDMCDADELESLAGASHQINKLIASSKNASAQTLEKLSRSDDRLTRECVAGNPNTPLDILNNLADEYPVALLLNPAFHLSVLKDPIFSKNLHGANLVKILNQQECPQSIVDWACKYYNNRYSFDGDVLRSIVKNPHTPIETLISILLLDFGGDITCEEGLL
jgi:hypothetical protein